MAHRDGFGSQNGPGSLAYLDSVSGVFLPALTFWRQGLRQQIYRRIWPNHCQHCGVNMTGNLTGRCQSCKTPYLSEVSPRFSTRRRSWFARLMFRGAFGTCFFIVIMWAMSIDWALSEPSAPALRWDYLSSAGAPPAAPARVPLSPNGGRPQVYYNVQQYLNALRFTSRMPASSGPGATPGTEFWLTARNGNILFNWRSLVYGLRDETDSFPTNLAWAEESRFIRPVLKRNPNFKSGFAMVPMGFSLVLAGLATFFFWWRIRPNPYGYCQSCGYNLTGNVTGQCPECRTPCDPRRRKPGHRRGRWSRRIVIAVTIVPLLLAATVYWIGTSRSIGRVGDGWACSLHSASLAAQWRPGSAGESDWHEWHSSASPPRYWPVKGSRPGRPRARVSIPLSLTLAASIVLFTLTVLPSSRRL